MNHPPIPLDHHCSVIHYESAGIWALEKASGVLTHPNKEAGKGKRSKLIGYIMLAKKLRSKRLPELHETLLLRVFVPSASDLKKDELKVSGDE